MCTSTDRRTYTRKHARTRVQPCARAGARFRSCARSACARARSLSQSLSLSLSPSLCPALPLSFYTQHYLVDTIIRHQKDKNEKDRPVDDGKGKIFDASQYFCLLPRVKSTSEGNVKSTSQGNVINRVSIKHTTSGKRMVERL